MNFLNLEYELNAGYPKIFLAGADEVGRGCTAGPVVAGAVVLPSRVDFEKDSWLEKVDDSKKVRPLQRERLAPLIRNWAAATGIGVATVEEIDQINIFHASHLAIVRAIQALSIQPHHILIDGKFLPREGLHVPASAIIQGDQKSLAIAAASILAKVWRDALMHDLDLQYPGYGFAQHKGYPTSFHAQAIRKQGMTAIHRRSFSTRAALA